MEKFTWVEYGKRKLYMMIGLAGAGGMLLLCSFLTAQSHAKTFAVLILLTETMMAMVDISTHAVMLK